MHTRKRIINIEFKLLIYIAFLFKFGAFTELPETGQQLEIDGDLLLEHVGLEHVDSAGIVSRQ